MLPYRVVWFNTRSAVIFRDTSLAYLNDVDFYADQTQETINDAQRSNETSTFPVALYCKGAFAVIWYPFLCSLGWYQNGSTQIRLQLNSNCHYIVLPHIAKTYIALAILAERMPITDIMIALFQI